MRTLFSPLIPFGFVVAVVAAAVAVRATDPPAVRPLALAHAHNDYLHPRPLHDALDHGFTSVEADIFLIDGKLLVGHSLPELAAGRTLQALYLDPLRERARLGGGRVYREGKPFDLLIDLKSAAEPTYTALTNVLAQYANLVTVVRDGQVETKAVQVIISGNRPLATMEAERVRYAGVDGRLSDLDSQLPSHLMPLISDNWSRHFAWRGEGTISEAEERKLADAVTRAHAHGRRIRFWGTPDTVPMWRMLRAQGVDLINTDDLPGLAAFLRESPSF